MHGLGGGALGPGGERIGEPVVELAAAELQATEAASGSADAPSEPAAPTDADPVGDTDLLADLGVPSARLLEWCGHDGMLPSDITAEVCQALGCGDEIEELREA